MNGKPRDMDYKFAIKVLQGTKVDTPSIHGNPKRYGYQNQTFYDIARNMAIQALKEKYENSNAKTPRPLLKKEILENVMKSDLTSFDKTCISIVFERYVEVVKCKDCKFWDSGRCESTKNGLIREYTQPNDFCSYGERSESA